MEEISYYSSLTFPQYYEAGVLHYHIMVLPRNVNLLDPIDGTFPAFVNTDFKFETKVINKLDGLPIFSAITQNISPSIKTPLTDKLSIIKEIIRQMEQNDGLKISENPAEHQDKGAKADRQKFAAKNVAIRKYLPVSYRRSFNFTSPKTRFAITDDEYSCIIKNNHKTPTDVSTQRNYISWGKLIAMIIRNPLLAEKAGFIYKASMNIDPGVFEKGGYLFTQFATGTPLENIPCSVYASRIPALKEDRKLFASVLFPVKDIAASNVTYDRVMQESILYNDGFAKIVHANQPINQDLLQETDTSNPPLKDIGIRLGWDDEQLTIWGNRQLQGKDEDSDLPIDAPLGVFGYKLDVRLNGETNWSSQNLIQANQDIPLGNSEILARIDQSFELPTEVHPSSHGNTMEEGFWLPMYFASWNGKSMVIPDKDAAEIYGLDQNRIPVANTNSTNAVNLKPKTTFHPYRQEERSAVPLIYGNDYQFRIRLMDISGGGPDVHSKILNGGQKPIADAHFIRNIKAGSIQVLNIKEFYESHHGTEIKDSSDLENILGNQTILRIKRPDLSYPSVKYTGKYRNAEELLKNKINELSTPQDPNHRRQYSVGLPDPDVNSFKILVEVRSLEMDNVLSESGKEAYILWQEKTFMIPNDIANENYELEAEINIVYQNFSILDLRHNFTGESGENDLILPTSRKVRLTIIPIVDNADDDYAAKFIEKGTPLLLTSYKQAENEDQLLSPIKGGSRAFYLQPESRPDLLSFSKVKLAAAKIIQNPTSVELQRLAEALDLSVSHLTLEGKKGQRVQFGVSSEIRHSLSPESGSVTFSSVNELFDRWIVAIDFSVLRDWSWQGLKEDSFIIRRKILGAESAFEIGSIQMKDVANMTMLNKADRSQSRILFLDSIDPKKYLENFPKEINAKYSIEAQYKDDSKKVEGPLVIDLPITIIPHQMPKLVSAGVALSSYEYDRENYRFSNEREKYLWFEFEEPPLDPNDTYFARVLAYSPDPYLCRMNKNLIETISEDLPFNLNEEKIREIIPGMEDDFAGLGVMQELIAETKDGAKTYLLPLPEGLHNLSDELFGFFTYEVRVGHKSWSTAQGRYGRPLKVNGVQHPAPELNCSASRSEINNNLHHEKFIEITANHANAVLNGENIAAFPPNTSLWYLLYTQVMQADGKSFRNILIDSGPMFYKIKKSENHEIAVFKESGNRMGKAKIPLKKLGDLLENLGLPRTNNLSAVAAEMFPLNNKWQYNPSERLNTDSFFIDEYFSNIDQIRNPLVDQLGQYRIYRTSKLISITEVCCEDC